MPTQEFALRLATAVLLGGVIGFERQWRQRMAGLRTNTLVATGAALFVTMTALAKWSVVAARPEIHQEPET